MFSYTDSLTHYRYFEMRSYSISARPFFMWECCMKEMVILNHREYKFSIFSMNSRKSWGIFTVAWFVLVSTASTQLPFVHFLTKQAKIFMLENILLFKILKLTSVGIWGCKILFVCGFLLLLLICWGFFFLHKTGKKHLGGNILVIMKSY